MMIFSFFFFFFFFFSFFSLEFFFLKTKMSLKTKDEPLSDGAKLRLYSAKICPYAQVGAYFSIDIFYRKISLGSVLINVIKVNLV